MEEIRVFLIYVRSLIKIDCLEKRNEYIYKMGQNRLVLEHGLWSVGKLLMEGADQIRCMVQVLGGDPGGFLISAFITGPPNKVMQSVICLEPSVGFRV